MPERSVSVEERFATIAEALCSTPGVTLGSGRRGFGSDALRVHGRIFGMVSRGRLVLKLPRGRVDELRPGGDGTFFDAGKGRPMREWIVLSEHSANRWLDLAREASAFVARSAAASRRVRSTAP